MSVNYTKTVAAVQSNLKGDINLRTFTVETKRKISVTKHRC